MSTGAIESVLNEYRDQITDLLATELSRAQRQTEEHSLALINKALTELEALQEQVAMARDAALEEAAKVADADAIMDDEGEREASLRGATEVAVRFKCRAIAVRGVAEGIRALKRGG